MSKVVDEIKELEDALIAAELGPDPKWFEEHLDNNMVMVANGEAAKPKAKVVEAHVPGKAPKFTRVAMTDMEIIEHGHTVVVTCKGTYEFSGGAHNLKFMRVWTKKTEGWRIIAGTVS